MKATILISSVCNHDCEFCLNIWNNQNNKIEFDQFIKLNKYKETFDKLIESGVNSITICGGEPMLHPEFRQIIDYSHNKIKDSQQKNKKQITIRLQTNGSMLNKQMALFLKDKVTEIEISLHGTKEVHERISKKRNFEKLISNIKNANMINLPITTNFVINKMNTNDLENYIHLVNLLEIKGAYFTRLYKAGKANLSKIDLDKKEMNDFLLRLSKYSKSKDLSKTKLFFQGCYPPCELNFENIEFLSPCGAGKDEIAIQPNGTVTLCPAHPKAICNIFTMNLNKVNEMIKDTQGYLMRQELPKAACSTCALLKSCRGGCLINRMGGTESIIESSI